MIPVWSRGLLGSHKRSLYQRSGTRLQLKFSTSRGGNTSGAVLHVIGTGGGEVAPTLCLVSGKHRYWINCGEGTSRTVSAFRFGWSSTPVVLFTRKAWENIAGFCSLYWRYSKATIFDGTVPVIGPEKSMEAIQKILTTICGKKSLKEINDVDDEVFKISRINLAHDLAAYHFKQYGRKGTLDIEKAISLGVPVGRALSALKDGKDYQTSSGKIVKSVEIVGPSKKGASFVILECPDGSYIDSVCNHHQLQPSEFSNQEERLDFMVHIAPLEVINTEKYCVWMSKFGSEVRHIFLHSSVCPAEIAWRDSFGLTLPFHMMNPEVFHIPSVPKSIGISWSSSNIKKHLNEEQMITGRSRLSIHVTIGKRSEVDFSKVFPPLETYVDDAYAKVMKYCHTNIRAYHQSFPGIEANSLNYVQNANSPKLLHSSDTVITFLGTSGGDNTNYRNESSILVQCASGRNIMLDCGESTMTQLQKCFGEEKSATVLSNIQVIFISHMHPDHWSGLFEVLRQRRKTCKADPITVIAPSTMHRLMSNYFSFSSDIDCDLINASEIKNEPYFTHGWSIKVIPVHHIMNSFGVKLCKGEDWSVVYSGDTIPCSEIIEEAKNASLLIHEGTFSGDRNNPDIALERHCLYSEAVKAGQKCGADFTAITHFSSAETLFPLVEPIETSIVPAVDYMSLKLSDIARHQLDSQEASRVYQSIAVYCKALRHEDSTDESCFSDFTSQ